MRDEKRATKEEIPGRAQSLAPRFCSCGRVNPPEATYCYFDGLALGGAGADGGPVHAGSQPFPRPFAFPSGVACRNFDQLAVACQKHWAEAVRLLRKGYLTTFLGGLGRADLARVAQESARFPDADRGLDQLLGRLPSDVLQPPQLDVAPRQINLGTLAVGEDRQVSLHLMNRGQRLLYGSASSDDAWLGLGDAPGAAQKLFQFDNETHLSLYVRGAQLRAGLQPLEGQLIVESNGDSVTVLVRADVPVVPFPEGVLAGARIPREIADRARAAPREAAGFFQNGAVARWYQANGWTYPVQGPVAEGPAAVQQFFDALGLTQPAPVEISARAVALHGPVGAELTHALELRTDQNRLMYAHAASDQDWLHVLPARLDGRLATIPLIVPIVPACEGETLTAQVTILANGREQLIVPVTLEVGGSFHFDAVRPAAPSIESPPPAPVDPTVATAPPPAPRRPGRKAIYAIVAGGIGLALVAAILWGIFRTPRDGSGRRGWQVLIDEKPLLEVRFNRRMRFGLVMPRAPDPLNPGRSKRLTQAEDGRTNNTCLRLDELEVLFGQPPGVWPPERGGRTLKQTPLGRNRHGSMSVMEYPRQKVRVRQTVEIVANDQTGQRDTALVHYRIDNADTMAHVIGLRVLLDPCVGSRDGVPFVIPDHPEPMYTMLGARGAAIPDFLQLPEHADFRDPGVVAQLGLRLPGPRIQPDDPEPEPPASLLISRWPGNPDIRWNWDPQPFARGAAEPGACIALYWDEQPLAAGASRAVAFTYGLGQLSSTTSGNENLSLTVGGCFRAGEVFTVMAYVKTPEDGQRIKLTLPPGLTLAPRLDGAPPSAEETVPTGAEYSTVSWRIRIDPAARAGRYDLRVTSGTMQEQIAVRVTK